MTLSQPSARIESPLRADGLPTDAALETSLSRVVGSRVVVLSRERNVFSSVSDSEVVQVRMDADELRLLVKYEDGTRRHTGHGYWGDETYEAMVYRDVLAQLGADVPRFYGLGETPSGRCLVIEYVDGERLSKAPREALVTAARWLGGFHRSGEALVARDGSAGINVLDAGYFRGWAERTCAFTRPRQIEHPWIEVVCTAFAAAAPSLATGETTVVHGEYYPRNILLARDSVFPVDWQSAAIGPGEIDVASLIEGWGNGEIVARAIDEYTGTRWPQGEPEGFRRRLQLARVYWPLRWLGDNPDWSVSPKRAHYIDELAAAAQDAGLWDRGGAL